MESPELLARTAGIGIVISSAAIVTADFRAAVTDMPVFKRALAIKPPPALPKPVTKNGVQAYRPMFVLLGGPGVASGMGGNLLKGMRGFAHHPPIGGEGKVQDNDGHNESGVIRACALNE